MYKTNCPVSRSSYDLENMEKWSAENKMFINTEKTKALQPRLDATNIDQLSHHKLLGLITDKDFSFEACIDE